ncbi:accessory Sec system S-layer assembly protein [Oceanobacillus senegalensis]|uniref:accessory Sec system S-layer assembly protein n=1 Tax=Oceanobacillus senegalensis TaxID=1936063 RepID=UPI000A3060A1|nr:accessory Sec system S-layer assembly protein [Oceanobacillus senegalensis]
MLGFPKKKKKKKQEESIDANEYLQSQTESSNTEELETELSVPSDWKMPNEERYVFAFHNSQSPKLRINQISIYGTELNKLKNKGFVANGLIRNTVPKNIKFSKTTILLLGPDKEIIAKKEFDLEKAGTIPANSARPWKFIFNKDDLLKDVEEIPSEWSLAFELKKKHQLDLEESWEKSIADETKSNLEKIVQHAKPLKPGEVNFMGVQAKQHDNGELAVTILIRNGSEKNITLQQIPLGIKDASEEEIARGGFKLDNFTVKANTSKPWTFIFPASMIKKEDIDLSKWQVYPIQ